MQMKTRIIKADPARFRAERLAGAARTIREGGLCVFPTETVYGIGGDATSPDSAKKIYAAKGRPSDNPLIIHVAFPEEAERYAVTVPLYYKLAKHFMPGPLTVIMRKRDTIPLEVTGGLDTVAVRCPSHPVAHELIRLAGVPVAAPSANISGRPSATSARYAAEDFSGKVEYIIDGGPCEVGLESTIVKITGDDSLLLLRPGAVTYEALLCVCSEVSVSEAAAGAVLRDGERPECPGMKYRHYAPSKPLTLVKGSDAARTAFFRARLGEGQTVVICSSELASSMPEGSEVIDIGPSKDLATQSRRIFAALRMSDELPGNRIFAEMPETEGIGLALYNRLIRAAAHTVADADAEMK